jgi:hypothetical protein
VIEEALVSKLVMTALILLLAGQPAFCSASAPTDDPQKPEDVTRQAAGVKVWRIGRQCGRNVIYMLLKLQGVKPAYSDVESRIPIRESGSRLTEMRDCARSLGLGCKIVRASPDVWESLRLPAIAHTEERGQDTGHYVLVVKKTPDAIVSIDGTTGNLSELSTAEFNELWTGYLLVAEGDSSRRGLYGAALAVGLGAVALTALVRRKDVKPAQV